MEPYVLDLKLEEFATETEWRILQKLGDVGFATEAAMLLNISPQRVNKVKKNVRLKAAKRGYDPNHDLTHIVPDGQMLRGVSGLYRRGESEPVLQWVKTSIDAEKQMEIIQQTIESLSKTLPREAPTEIPKPAHTDLMVNYPLGDCHIGMYAWEDETGTDWDLDKSVGIQKAALNALVDATPDADEAAIVILGDFLHFDSYEAVTPKHRNQLDASARFPEMIDAAISLVRWMVRRVLMKHRKVHLVIAAGNHDDKSAMLLRAAFKNIYEEEVRLKVHAEPTMYHYIQFGKCMVGVTHGHKCKLESLPLLMATTQATMWGDTSYRYWYTGHVHLSQIKEFSGVCVETFGILPPQDAHAVSSGHASQRSMKAIVLHKEFGEVARHTVNPKMLGFA